MPDSSFLGREWDVDDAGPMDRPGEGLPDGPMPAASARAMGRLYPRGSVDDVLARIVGLIEGDDALTSLGSIEAEARRWWIQSGADGFPSRASGAEPGGGASNVVHDFGTAGRPELLEVPQVSDSTGETVANRDRDRVYVALWEYRDDVIAASRLLSRARARLVGAVRAPETLEGVAAARSREWCWSCMRATTGDGDGTRVHTPVYRERDRHGIKTPLCRKCYDWCAAHDEVFPLVAIVLVWHRGETLTSSRLREIVEASKPASRRRKAKRRRAS